MKTTLLFFCLLLSQFAYFQNSPAKFGQIRQADVDITSYANDPKARGVVLFDVGKSEFLESEEGGYHIRFTRHKRVKVFDKSEVTQTEVSIPYYMDGFGRTEDISKIEAITFNLENGKLIRSPLDPSQVFEEKINKQWRRLKFTFPNVQKGSILELRYTLITPFHFHLPDWEFQTSIPTLHSEYQACMIPFYEYVYTTQGISAFDTQETKQGSIERSWGQVSNPYGMNNHGFRFKDNIHTFAMTDIPAFADESYITSKDDYIMKIDFQLARFNRVNGGVQEIISTWPELNKRLLQAEHFGRYLRSAEKIAHKQLQNELRPLLQQSKTEKQRAIIEYVKKTYTWNNHYSKYASQNTKSFITQKTGNSAEINLYLIALLREAGIQAEPVIISTRGNGKVRRSYPFEHYTNYVIALIKDNDTYLADATEDLLPYDRLPIRCLNSVGLVVEKTHNDQWIAMERDFPSIDKKLITTTIDPKSMQSSHRVSIQTKHYDSYTYRTNFRNDTIKLKKELRSSYETIHKIKTVNYDNIKRPYSINFTASHPIEQIGTALVLYPFSNFVPTKNSLTQKERNYPVDLIFSNNSIFDITIEVPKLYTPVQIPESLVVDDELMQIKLTSKTEDKFIHIQANYNFKKSIYPPEVYHRLKAHLDILVEKFNESIVLEKISE